MTDEAGPEFNAWIAENVMGWKRLSDRPAPESPGFPISFLDLRRWMMPGGATTSDLPDYTGLIAAAWEVFEKLFDDGNNVWIVGKYGKAGYECHHTSDCLEPGKADTAPLAICRAAKALKEKT